MPIEEFIRSSGLDATEIQFSKGGVKKRCASGICGKLQVFSGGRSGFWNALFSLSIDCVVTSGWVEKITNRKFWMSEPQIYSISQMPQKFNFQRCRLRNFILPEFAENCSSFPVSEVVFGTHCFHYQLIVL